MFCRSVLEFEESRLDNCSALTGNGGGLFMTDTSRLQLRKSFITYSTAARFGGALHAQARSDVLVEGSVLRANSADNGGAVHTAGHLQMRVRDTRLQDNVANFEGAALFLTQRTDDDILLANVEFDGNSAFQWPLVALGNAFLVPAQGIASNLSLVGSPNVARGLPNGGGDGGRENEGPVEFTLGDSSGMSGTPPRQLRWAGDAPPNITSAFSGAALPLLDVQVVDAFGQVSMPHARTSHLALGTGRPP